jgi:hypothetical protein
MNLTDRTVPEHPSKTAAEPNSIRLPTDDAIALPLVVSAQALPVENSTASALKAGVLDIPEVRAPSRDEMLVARMPLGGPGFRFRPIAGVLLTTLGIGFVGGWIYYGLLDSQRVELSANNAIATLVERIVQAESSGCATLKNKRSTATGTAQFLDETWLRLIRTHRPELALRTEKEVLEMRRDPDLSREITARLAQRNAEILRKRAFSVTPATLYLSHFAGSAGAIAILSAPETADAAATMANADATGRSTRDKIAYANPFLERFTVADLKSWAERKMNMQPANQTCSRVQQSGPVGRLRGGARKS